MGERLSLDATFPNLRDLERRYGSVTRGLNALRDTSAVNDTPPFVSFAGGMGELVEHLEARLREASILTNVEVVALEPRTGEGFVLVLGDNARVEADAVILATPAPATARIMRALDRELSELHAAIAYAASVTVSVAFRERDLPRPVAGYGYVVPRVEGSDVVACTVASNKWPGRAPEGHALFRVYLRAHDGGDITGKTDDALVDAARRELKEMYGIARAPVLVRVGRWPVAIPQYTLGHGGRVAEHPRAADRTTAPSSSRERPTPAWAFRTASLPARRLPTRRSCTASPPTGRPTARQARRDAEHASKAGNSLSEKSAGRRVLVFRTPTHIELSLRNFSHDIEKFFTRTLTFLPDSFGVELQGWALHETAEMCPLRRNRRNACRRYSQEAPTPGRRPA